MNNKLLYLNLEDVMSDRFGRYSKYIIQDRALPDVRDGLKPVQRRILYAMYKEGNLFERPHRKSAKTVGLVIGNYHPHGDSSVYDAMVRMSQNWKMRECLIDMHGNNGSIDDDPAAAMRYTEARLAKISNELIGDLDKDTVNFVYNFDDTELEPTVFPARFLNILVNGASGIAAGYATKIPPHNLNEVAQACIYRLMHPNCTLNEIMEILPGPDFPTGGIVQGRQGIVDAFTSGSGRLVLRAKTTLVETKQVMQIVISEIPYEVIKSNLVESIDKIRINKELDGIVAVRDETDRNGLRIVIECKKEANHELILNYLLKKTQLQVYFNYNMVCIVDKKPMQLGLINIIDAYLAFYEEFILRLTRHEIQNMNQRLHLLEGLMKAVSIMDEIIAMIRASKDKTDAKNRLILAFEFSEDQAEAIVMMRLHRLTSTDIKKLRMEVDEINQSMKQLLMILNDQSVLKKAIAGEINEVAKQYGSPRMTLIEDEVVNISIDKTALVNSMKVMVALSQDGYLKQSSLRSYNASMAYPPVRENDLLIGIANVDTLDQLLLFSSDGNYACLPVYAITETKWKEPGVHVNTYVNFKPKEKIVDGVVVNDFQQSYQVLSISAQGMIRRSLLSDYALQRWSRISSCFKLKNDDQVVRTLIVKGDEDLMIMTNHGYTLKYSISEVPLTGINTQGVKAINLSKGDMVSDLQLVKPQDMACLFTSNNQVKRIRVSDLSFGARAKKGELACKINKSNPVIVNRLVCGELNDNILLANHEMRCIKVKEIALMDMQASFSNSLKLADNAKVVVGIQYADGRPRMLELSLQKEERDN
jgi:topoisomerase IV subunit A